MWLVIIVQECGSRSQTTLPSNSVCMGSRTDIHALLTFNLNLSMIHPMLMSKGPASRQKEITHLSINTLYCILQWWGGLILNPCKPEGQKHTMDKLNGVTMHGPQCGHTPLDIVS